MINPDAPASLNSAVRIPIPFPPLGRWFTSVAILTRLQYLNLSQLALMADIKQSFGTIEELRQYVAETLGKLESLRSDIFPLTEDIRFRSGEPCGIYFCLHGPAASATRAFLGDG